MKIPFTKAHGAKNDFLLTWRRDAPGDGYPEIARAICDRYTGIGADGWMLVDPAIDAEAEGAIELYNSDGSAPELSGNGTRCAAAFLIEKGYAPSRVRIRTGAGIKTLRLLHRTGLAFEFEMNMGTPRIVAERFELRALNRPTRCHAGGRGQPPVRRAGGLFRLRLALDGRRDRTASAFSQSHQRFIHSPRGRSHHRCAVLRARRGRDKKLRHWIDGRGSRGRGARHGAIPGARPHASRTARSAFR